MTRDYGRPPRSVENQELIQRRLKEVTGSAGVAETVTVEWRSTPAHMPVIQLPVGNLYYNPATHRVRAQRSHDPQQDSALERDPWSVEGQAYLARLLKATPARPADIDPDFVELRESLRTYGQTDPGLVTRDGVLVNGNTRHAALLEIFGPTHEMRVAILPESCDWGDVSRVELSLQLRKDHRRDYSYINRLLAVEELAAQGTDLGVIATTFRSTRATIEQDLWVLNSLQDLISRSSVGEARLQLVAFEEHKEKLRELHRVYTKELQSNPDKAELLKETRLAAIALGLAKTDVRGIEADFRRRYLDAKLADADLASSVPEPAAVVIPGLGRSVKGSSSDVVAARRLTDEVLKAKTRSVVATGSAEGDEKFESFKSAFRDAIEPALKDQRIQKKKQLAPGLVDSASNDIERSAQELILARGSRSLDEGYFDDTVLRLRGSLEKLAAEAAKTIPLPGDGVSWLLETFHKGA